MGWGGEVEGKERCRGSCATREGVSPGRNNGSLKGKSGIFKVKQERFSRLKNCRETIESRKGYLSGQMYPSWGGRARGKFQRGKKETSHKGCRGEIGEGFHESTVAGLGGRGERAKGCS